MKKVMFALCFLFGGIVVVSAQDTQDTTSNQYRTETESQYPQDALGQQGQDRERIQSTELPDEVKRALEGEEYRGWLVSGAFKAQASDQSLGADTTSTDPSRQGNVNATTPEDEEIYIVELKNGAETKEVRFDSNGQKIEGMEGDQNMQNNQYNQQENNQYNQQPEDQMNRDNQMNQNDQVNPNDQMDNTTPSDQARPTDPNATDQSQPIDQPDQGQFDQSRQDHSTQPDQSSQTPSSQQWQTDQPSSTPSTTPSGQTPGTETQNDQSRTNRP